MFRRFSIYFLLQIFCAQSSIVFPTSFALVSVIAAATAAAVGVVVVDVRL